MKSNGALSVVESRASVRVIVVALPRRASRMDVRRNGPDVGVASALIAGQNPR